MKVVNVTVKLTIDVPNSELYDVLDNMGYDFFYQKRINGQDQNVIVDTEITNVVEMGDA